jgi:hypothetical protein
LRLNEEAESVHHQQSRSKHATLFEQHEGAIVRADVNVSILAFNEDQEEVEQWIN